VLVLFAPLWWIWSSPEMLLVAQAVIVATGALPAFWLGRRWIGDDRLALAGAAAYLLYPAVQHATLFDFHPVTLAAPLLLFSIWAAEEARWVTLGVCAALAALCQEQVGLLIAALAVWLWFRHPDRRRAAVILGTSALAWVATAVLIIMPAFALQSSNAHIGRYSRLGDSPRDIALTFLTRPWEAVEIIATPGRLGYLASLLLPLLLLPLAAPMLALVALPQLGINLFASTGPAQTVDYHYAILLSPVFVAAALLGLARLRGPSRAPCRSGAGCPAAGTGTRATPSRSTPRPRRWPRPWRSCRPTRSWRRPTTPGPTSRPGAGSSSCPVSATRTGPCWETVRGSRRWRSTARPSACSRNRATSTPSASAHAPGSC
jgi:uncharacterized membrane protein